MGNPRRLVRSLSLATLLLCACSSAKPEAPRPPDETVYLSALDRLGRISMALKGTRPSIADSRAVDADPAALGAIVDGYLESDEFGATLRDLHNEALLVRASVR